MTFLNKFYIILYRKIGGIYTNYNNSSIVNKITNKIDDFAILGNTRDSIPVTIDENEHEIGTFNGEKLYQKTFIRREVNVTSSNRTWYTIVDSSELDKLNIGSIFFIDYFYI